jgi:thiamine kinase-like enzyme
MLWDELKSVVSRHVPGEGTPDIHRSSDGLVNETYRVLRDGSVYALRVADANSYDLGLDRAWEARVLERAVAAGLAPELTYCDPQRGIVIARWVDGRLWSPADVRRQANVSRMTELMRRIHALPMPTPARVMGPAAWIDYYSAAVRQGIRDPSAGPAAGGPAAPSAAGALRAAATARLAALALLPNVDPVVCHSDLHTLNLVDRGHSLMLLDWEYAHAADPLWDLAGWSANNDLEDELKHALLASYAGRPPTRNESSRMQLLGWLYDYVCLLWSELYLNLHRDDRPGVATRRDDPQGGIAARAQLLAARLNASK